MTADVDGVGPVLLAHAARSALVEAILRLNPGAEVRERGSYVRVLVPRRCVVTRAAVEDILGHPFDLRAELEAMMPSFKGRLVLADDEAVWSFGPAS
jgi:toluene monooxygenase system protein D